MKRFYKVANVSEFDDGFAVVLDGRPMRTPAGAPLTLSARAAAQLLAAEWDRQGETVDMRAMPLTRLVNVAIDRTPDAREGVAAEIARHGETDLLCHLAGTPAELAARQAALWTPLRDWAAETLGAPLVPVRGVLAAAQPQDSLERLRTLALALDNVRLTALAHATALLGSAVLGFALQRERLTADEAFALSMLDADWQAEQWGRDAEAETKAAALRSELGALESLFIAIG